MTPYNLNLKSAQNNPENRRTLNYARGLMSFPWKNKGTATIGLGGDVMLGRLVDEYLNVCFSDYPWGNLLPILKSTDFNFINLETTLTVSSQKVLKVFNFKAHPSRVKTLLAGSIQAANLANNHILDFSYSGLEETIATLDRAGIAHVGAGNNIEEAKNPLCIDIEGIKIGIIGCSDNEPSWLATDKHPGIYYLKAGDLKAIEKEITRLKEMCDLLILSIHWGPNMRQRPTKEFVDFAHHLIDSGVNILHGHSAHIFQGVEVYKQGLILYDCGDFVDDYAVDPYLRNDYGFFFIADISKKGFKKVYLVPTLISDFQVNRAKEKELIEAARRQI